MSGRYDERREWVLHPLTSALFRGHIISRVWRVAAGSPARAVPDEHPGPPDAKFRGLATSEFYQAWFSLFVCLFTTSGYTHTHTRTREYAFWSVGFAMVGTHVRSRFPGHLAWSPYREMVFGACRNPNSVLLQVTPTLGAQLWMRQIHKQFPTQRLRSRGDSESQHGLPPQASSGFRSRARPQNEGAHSCRSRVAHTVTGSR